MYKEKIKTYRTWFEIKFFWKELKNLFNQNVQSLKLSLYQNTKKESKFFTVLCFIVFIIHATVN